MPRRRRARRTRKTWLSSSEDSVGSEMNRLPPIGQEQRGCRSLPDTPQLSKDASLLKVALNKTASIERWIQGVSSSRVDSRLMETFPTFHGISVASGSPTGVRRCSSDVTVKAFTHQPPHTNTSDPEVSNTERESSSAIEESSDAGKEDLRRKRISLLKERPTKRAKSFPRRERNVGGRERSALGGKESDSEGERTIFRKERNGRVRSRIFVGGGGKCVYHVPEGKRNVSGLEKSHGRERKASGKKRDLLKLESSVHGRDGNNDGKEERTRGTENCSEREEKFPENEESVRKREIMISERGSSVSGEKDVPGREGTLSRRKNNISGIDGSLLKRERCVIRKEISVSERGFSVPGKEEIFGGREDSVAGRNKSSPEGGNGRTEEENCMLERDGSYLAQVVDGQKDVGGSVGGRACVAMQSRGHTSTSTRVLLDLIRELEANMVLESDVESEGGEATQPQGDSASTQLWPEGPGTSHGGHTFLATGGEDVGHTFMATEGHTFLATGGVCLNVTRRPKTKSRTIDHFNLDSSAWRSDKGSTAPTDFFAELTQILDRKLRMSKATEEPPDHHDPDNEFWEYIKTSGVVDPLTDHRFQTATRTAREFRSQPNLFTFALSLSDVDSVECEPDLEENTLLLEAEVEGEECSCEGVAGWLQTARELLPPGVEWCTMDSSTCLELALEGERLCKAGDCRAGVAFFEAAIQTGTDDLRTLSAIYSQLGNAYFYLGEYDKAMEYHKLDLTVARTMGDRLGVAKASGNLGNTLKVMGKFKEAICCCERHLSISQELQDKVGEGRALYNLGNVYHAQGKHLGRIGPQEPGGFSDEVKHCLQKAVEYYAANLRLMEELNDRSAQGRACGNLGNTHYLLGNFTQAISYHNERLAIAKEFGDKAAERRAHSNLGNAHIFLGEFETAAEHYKKTLQLAQELGDRAVEAQACYSLGNTYTLLRDYPMAIHYHLRHLAIAEELTDKVGEGRACWSLGNAYSATNNNEKALHYATRHLEISKEIGDKTGQAAAQMNLSDIRKVLGLPPTATDSESSESAEDAKSRTRRKSMENMDLLKMTPDAKGVLRKYQSEDAGIGSMSSDDSHPVNGPSYNTSSRADKNTSVNEESSMDDDSFFELLSRFQSKRMDDQRCTLSIDSNKENQPEQAQQQVPCHREGGSVSSDGSTNGTTPSDSGANNCGVLEELMESIAGMQSRRMDEQRASLPQLPGLNNQHAILQRLSVAASDSTPLPDDNFFDMLMRCQGSRIEDQRSSLPNEGSLTHSAPTVPDDDFFSLIMRFQSGRLEDQRSTMPLEATRNSTHPATDEEDPPSSAQSTGTKDGLVSRLVKGRK